MSKGYGVMGILGIIVVMVLVWAIVDGPGVRLSWADEGDSPFQVIVNNNIPSGGGSGGGGAPPLVLADFEVPETVSPVLTGLVRTLAIPFPSDGTYHASFDNGISTNRSYVRLPPAPPDGYCSTILRHRTDARGPNELETFRSAIYVGPTATRGTSSIRRINMFGIGNEDAQGTRVFLFGGNASPAQIDNSSGSNVYSGPDITNMPPGLRIEILAIPCH